MRKLLLQLRPVVALLTPLAVVLLAVGPPCSASVLDEIKFHRIAADVGRVIGIAHAGDGSGRLFFVVQNGQVLIHDGQDVLDTPFLDIESKVACCSERGLLSIAFHPDYKSNGTFFLFYNDSNSDIVVSRWQVSSDDPNVANPQSEEFVLHLEKSSERHNGGQLLFGPDGYLYISVGDDGEANDPLENGQDLSTPYGAILRVDVDTSAPYAVPATNPFVNQPGARPEIWAYGLRNPWRSSFDRTTGDMFIGDVGQAAMEEINRIPAGTMGQNFGWRLLEGTLCHIPEVNCDPGNLTPPILTDLHREGGCAGAITGGYRYRGEENPSLEGLYIYGDYCKGYLRAAAEGQSGWNDVSSLQTDFSIVTFGEDEQGELYLASLRGRSVYRLSTKNPPAFISAVSPSAAVAGNPDLTLMISGFDFAPEAQVSWNGDVRQTVVDSPTQIRVEVLASDIEEAGVVVLAVINPESALPSREIEFVVHSPPTQPPVITPDGFVDGASFRGARGIAPGGIASIFGDGLAVVTDATTVASPLPVALGGTRILLDEFEAPQSYVGPGQANIQVPWELAGRESAVLHATMGPVTSDPVTVELASFNPAIFTLDLNGQGAVFFAQNLGTAVAPRDSGFQARPALRGEIIVIWCTGLGAVSNQPPTGEAANANGLVAEAIVTPTVRIGRFIAEVLFAGLSPEFPGLYQINVRVPDGTPSGFAVPVLVTTGSRRSNEVFIAVE